MVKGPLFEDTAEFKLMLFLFTMVSQCLYTRLSVRSLAPSASSVAPSIVHTTSPSSASKVSATSRTSTTSTPTSVSTAATSGMTSASQIILTAPLVHVAPVHVEAPGPRPLSVPGAPHLLLLHVEPVVAVQEDGLGAQSPLYTRSVFKHNEAKVGNLEAGFAVAPSAGALSALLLVDPDLEYSPELGEEVAEILLRTAVRHVTHKQLLTVAILGCVLLLAEPLWPLTSLRPRLSRSSPLAAASLAPLVTPCPLHLASCHLLHLLLGASC